MTKKSQIATLTETIQTILRIQEKETGHMFSGGRGLSMFVQVRVRVPGFKRTETVHGYGNGVNPRTLRQALINVLGDCFVGLSTRLD